MTINRRNFLATAAVTAASGYAGAVWPHPEGVKANPIIDVHVHAYPAAMRFDGPIVNPITKQKSSIRNGADHMQACINEMRRLNVARAVVSGGDGDRIGAALEWRRAYPDQVIGGAGIRGSEDAPLPSIDTLRQLFTDGDLRVLGEVTAQYAGKTLSDPIYEPYLALAEDLGVPVAVHLGTMPGQTTFDPCCRLARSGLGHPESIEEALNLHPKLKINLMHSAWPHIEEAMAVMMIYDNVNIDTGALSWLLPAPAFRDYLRRMIDAGFGKRIMFGSDQMFWPDAIALAVERIETASYLSTDEKRDIFYNNAASFYGIRG